MSSPSSNPSPTQYRADDEFPGYRPLSGLAVVSFVFGLASVLVMSNLRFGFIPLLGVVFSVMALRRIAMMERGVTGRGFALAGLTLSLLFGLSAPTRAAITRWQMLAESRELAQQWFDALKERKPMIAFRLESAAGSRQSTDDQSKNPFERASFERFLDRPAVSALLTLGDKAQVRYFQPMTAASKPLMGGVSQLHVYAVTVDGGGARTTFFVELRLDRIMSYADESWGWHVASAEIRRTPPPAYSPPGV